MAANGRGNMRPAGRSPPFLAIGLFVALVILGFNYWSLSARNGEQTNEIVLLESELRLVNAKKTSAEKRSEAISDKVTELEKQLNEQKEVIAKNQADLANVEKEKLTFIERTNELENEVRSIRDQQLPICETDKKNLQQEVEQLRADIEVHKNKECGRSDCELYINKERDATIEDMYKVAGASPLISMYRGSANMGSYKDQIAKLAVQAEQEAYKKQQQEGIQGQQQPLDTQQQQQQQLHPVDAQQQQAVDNQQQQQQQIDVQQRAIDQQQQSVDQQQQQPQSVDGQQQQQQQQQVDAQQQQQADGLQQQQADGQQLQQADGQQQQQADGQQQQQADGQQQQQPPVDAQQQQQQAFGQQPADAGVQPADQNVGTGQGVVPAPDINQAPAPAGVEWETKKDASNLNEDADAKALDLDRQRDAQQDTPHLTNTTAEGLPKEAPENTTTTTTSPTTQRPGIKPDNPLISPNVAVTGTLADTNKITGLKNGGANTQEAQFPVDGGNDDAADDDDYKDDDDDDERNVPNDDTLRVDHNADQNDDDYDYDANDDDDDDYDYNEKTNALKKDDNAIDEMYRRDKAVVPQ